MRQRLPVPRPGKSRRPLGLAVRRPSPPLPLVCERSVRAVRSPWLPGNRCPAVCPAKGPPARGWRRASRLRLAAQERVRGIGLQARRRSARMSAPMRLDRSGPRSSASAAAMAGSCPGEEPCGRPQPRPATCPHRCQGVSPARRRLSQGHRSAVAATPAPQPCPSRCPLPLCPLRHRGAGPGHVKTAGRAAHADLRNRVARKGATSPLPREMATLAMYSALVAAVIALVAHLRARFAVPPPPRPLRRRAAVASASVASSSRGRTSCCPRPACRIRGSSCPARATRWWR